MFDEKSPSYPLSDHTRRLRRNLIIVAAIGIILVRFPEITLEKIPTSIGDFTAKDVGRNVVIGAINLICAYLLVFLHGTRQTIISTGAQGNHGGKLHGLCGFLASLAHMLINILVNIHGPLLILNR